MISSYIYIKDLLFDFEIEMGKSFRVGDIIISRVISLGDTNSYFLSCAENELGVVIAYSESGFILNLVAKIITG